MINETKSWCFEKVNIIDKALDRFIKDKIREEPKYVRSEMKLEKLQLTPQKYKRSQETAMVN